MRVFSSKENRTKGLLLIAGLLAAAVATYLLLRTYAPFVFDASAMRAWVASFGPAAPAVFVILQAAQVVVAPIPGQLTALVGGYLFGAAWGTLYSMIGVMIGSAIAFLLAQTFGRPVVEQLLHDDLVSRFDGFVEELGVPGLALFVVIPGLPDDAICFFAGLSHFGLVTFLAVILVARSPAYIATNFAGQGLASGAVIQAVVVLIALIVFSVVAYRKRDRIQQFVS
ncbi:MAG: TVP38/TMEM64 family protein [Salinirussus sp.]